MFSPQTKSPTGTKSITASEEGELSSRENRFAYLTSRHLIRLAYAKSDLRRSKDPDSAAFTSQRFQISEYIKIQAQLDPLSPDGIYLREFQQVSDVLCHYICSSRDKLDRDRLLCIEKRKESLALEAGVNTIGALLRLSGQLFLIGGLSGIIGWLFLGESKYQGTNEVHIAMSIAIAFASMIAGMAMQLRSMSKSNRAINYEYARKHDIAKETQVTSLIQGLSKTRDELRLIMRERFGESDELDAKTDISVELYQFELLRDRDNPELQDPWWQDFANYLKRICGRSS